MTAPRRLLVIHPGALGDVLQAVPALRALRGRERACRVSLAAQPRLARLLAGAGVVDEALSFDALGLSVLFTDDPCRPRWPSGWAASTTSSRGSARTRRLTASG
jgi:hypothetical protein